MKNNHHYQILAKRFPIEQQLISSAKLYEKAVCPYCNFKLKKAPSRRKQCPNCQQIIMVRTSYFTGKRMLITEEQAIALGEERLKTVNDQWVRNKYLQEGITDEEFDSIKAGTPGISDYDALWGILNRNSLEYAKCLNWGLFRNARLTMLEILYRENRYKQALQYAFEVCYYDLNGAMNTNGLIQYSFSLDTAFVAPGVICYILEIMAELGLTGFKLKELYLVHIDRVKNKLAPLSPEETWRKLELELKCG